MDDVILIASPGRDDVQMRISRRWPERGLVTTKISSYESTRAGLLLELSWSEKRQLLEGNEGLDKMA